MSLFSKKTLGIDIGSSSIKVVELLVAGKKKKLNNYLEFKLPLSNNQARTFNSESLLLLTEETAQVLQALLKRSKIKTKKAKFSLPDFSTFFTTFSLPSMPQNEIAQAVEFEARHHIPLPLTEVTFDWQIIEKETTPAGAEKYLILLVAIPNSVLQNYSTMAQLAGLEIEGMEAEVFAFVRSLYLPEKFQFAPLAIIDIGQQSTTLSIIENKKLRQSFSFDFSSLTLTKELAVALQISLEEAENMKVRFGLDPEREDVSKVLLSKIEILAAEAEKICEHYFQQTGKEVAGVVLSGGAASLFGVKEYFKARLKKDVLLANPFQKISFPLVLEKRLAQIGPSFCVAVGSALGGTED
ncbi:type IV pilus assembly protein PilM [Candidatus Gribaldobacteria bacterium]|nr:type IV pilus assembly protein PilM [Candidatus Gribaldobacteria bacterium]